MGIILSAVYTLNMIRKIFYGESKAVIPIRPDLRWNEQLVLGVIVILIFLMGIYPQPMLDLTDSVAQDIVNKVNTFQFKPK